MRDYGKVMPKFWTGETCKALRARASQGASKGPEGVLVALYLMTSPMSNMLGLYCQPILYVAHETGLGLEGARKGLRDCIEVGFCKYDETTETVWVVEMAAIQIARELKASDNRCAGIQKDYESLPKSPFLGEFFDRYQGAFHLRDRRGLEGASKPLPSQEQEQEQEQDQEQEQKKPSSLRDSSSASPDDAPGDLLGDKPGGKPGAADLAAARSQRLAQVTDEAIAAFNESKLVKPKGGCLAAVNAKVGRERRQRQVERCLRVARAICQEGFGASMVTPEFWVEYWQTVFEDDFHSGRKGGGKDHATWLPDFEYLTREATMLKIYDRASDSEAA